MQITLTSQELRKVAEKLRITYQELIVLIAEISEPLGDAETTEFHPRLLSTLPSDLIERLQAGREPEE
jgi:hypothetical protein